MASEKRRRQRRNRSVKVRLTGDGARYNAAIAAAARSVVQESAVAPAVEAVRGDLVPVHEAAIRADGTVALRLISPGWGSSGHYSAEVLETAGADRVFPAGTHMYLDHPTRSERSERPERSIRDLAAVLETDGIWQENHPDGPGIYAQARVFTPYRPVIAEMADHIGVSIRASAECSNGEAEGRRGRIIERIIEAPSVDFVTRPGRGGQVLTILESAHVTEAMADDVRAWLRDALRDRFGDGEDRWVWVRDYDADAGTVVFDLEGDDAEPGPGTYELAYTGSDDGVELSDDTPTKVRVTTSYEPVGEARNVAEWFQSRIHLHFTSLADDMFGEGRLTKTERITLSSGIGAALDAFSALVDEQAPQLLTRDLWDEPRPAEEPIDESQEDEMTPEEMKQAVADGIAEAIKPVNERLDKLEESSTEQAEVEETAEVRAQRAEDALLIREARDHVAGNQKVQALPEVARDRLVESVSNAAARTDDGALDKAALDEATTKAVDAEVEYLTKATGSPVRGIGEAAGSEVTAEESQTRLAASIGGAFGLSEDAAKHAAAGRR
jgi:hypothetical protein